MTLTAKKGDFKKLGVSVRGRAATFTFELENGISPALLFFEKGAKEPVRIQAENDFIYGRICSITVIGISYKNTGYLIEENKEQRMDPYAPVVLGRNKWNDLKRKKNNFMVLGGFSLQNEQWKDENRPYIHGDKMIIYSLHMRGFTMDCGLPDRKRGNYQGIISRLAYLKDLGVNVLEFQPIYDFEEVMYKEQTKIKKDGTREKVSEPLDKLNYWGYTDAQFFAPKASYFGGENPDIHMREMVRAIHRNGMEIIMEMSFPPDAHEDVIVDSLKYWASVYHIDGFRLIGMNMPVRRIAKDPYLGSIKFFYDHFPENLLQEENAKYRHLFCYDDRFLYPLRRLQNHKDGSIIEFANMMKRQNEKYGFVNYAASALEFTLRDSFSYIEKHNEENGENNIDGNNFNYTDNYGVEGDTGSRSVWNIRTRHIRTALGAVILSQGIPMIHSGDEIMNSQNGNNNVYCQDNSIGWVNFSRKKRDREIKNYVKDLIAFRNAHPVLSTIRPKEMRDYNHVGLPDLSYHGKEPWTVWLSEDRKALGILYAGAYGVENEQDVMLLFNFFLGEIDFALPRLLKKRSWFYVTNTSEAVWKKQEELLKDQSLIIVPGGSLTILIGKETPDSDEQL
jgi:isoamylase